MSNGSNDTANYIDVTIASPLTESTLAGSARDLKWLTKSREKAKRARYGGHPCFTHFVMNFSGGLGVEARRVVRRLADRLSQDSKHLFSDEVHRLYVRMSSTLMREQAKMVLASIPFLDRS